MNPHTTVHIQTLQNGDRPEVTIHFAPQLNRIADPAADDLVA